MVAEDYVSFETAKLLKEKGFDEGCRAHYGSDGSFSYEKYEVEASGCEMYNAILAPTLQMAMMWLRKEHNLAISTSVTVYGWSSYVSQIKLDGEGFVVDIIDGIDCGNIPNCDTYEEVCEAAIKYCLENLI